MITIIVPVFNQILEFLKVCLDSIQSQTSRNFEIIVIDDGSEKIIAEQNKNIAEAYDARYIYQENKGIGSARNRGILEAKGDYILFCSSDDWLVPSAVEDFLTSYKEDGLYFSESYIFDGIRQTLMQLPQFSSREDLIMQIVETAKQNRMFLNYNCFATTKFWKENLFQEDKKYGEDFFHLLESILVKNTKITFIRKPLFYYRIHESMLTAKLGINDNIKTNNKDTFKKINLLTDKSIFEVD